MTITKLGVIQGRPQSERLLAFHEDVQAAIENHGDDLTNAEVIGVLEIVKMMLIAETT